MLIAQGKFQPKSCAPTEFISMELSYKIAPKEQNKINLLSPMHNNKVEKSRFNLPD